MDSNARTPRSVAIADHLWRAYEQMAAMMGADREALINQAMFMFARLNGFLDTPPSAAQAPTPSLSRPLPAGGVLGTVHPPAAGVEGRVGVPPPLNRSDSQRREVAEKVLETAAELERMIAQRNPPDLPTAASIDAPRTSMGSDGATLFIEADSGVSEKVVRDRFLIGRGKHCDFVINSGKVSREHAVVVHEGDQFFIEDLGSSNGTWFNKQRIKRRRIEDNDEYFICSERVKFAYR